MMARKMEDPVTFTCAVCGDECESADLSRGSMKSAGTISRLEALEILSASEVTCYECDDAMQDWDATCRGRSERERFEFDGLFVDPARWQAHCLSY
jgi:hypothetical protein